VGGWVGVGGVRKRNVAGDLMSPAKVACGRVLLSALVCSFRIETGRVWFSEQGGLILVECEL
jgi:hypothetical protein